MRPAKLTYAISCSSKGSLDELQGSSPSLEGAMRLARVLFRRGKSKRGCKLSGEVVLAEEFFPQIEQL